MKKILIISNFYYPQKHIAVKRIDAFSKYFFKNGYDVTVLTKDTKDHFEIVDGIKIVYVTDKSIFKKANTNKQENKMLHYMKCLWNIFIIFAYNIQILNLFFQSIDKTLFSVI